MQASNKTKKDLNMCINNISTIHGLTRILRNLVSDDYGDIKKRDIVHLAEVIEKNLKLEKTNIDNIYTDIFGL